MSNRETDFQDRSQVVSIITVVLNNVNGLKRTLESFFSQTWQAKEIIVIDGGSTDGSQELLASVSSQLSYWCSEPDGGIYDAMNKGISHAQGEWICFLNSGDVFADDHSLQAMMTVASCSSADVLYGNSIELEGSTASFLEASADVNKMEYGPCYRHGSSLVRTEVQRRFLFDVSQKKKLGYALDWEMIFRMFRSGCTFQKVDILLEAYEKEGVSDHPVKSRWYNYQITSEGTFNIRKLVYFLYGVILYYLKKWGLYKWTRAFVMEWVLFHISHSGVFASSC